MPDHTNFNLNLKLRLRLARTAGGEPLEPSHGHGGRIWNLNPSQTREATQASFNGPPGLGRSRTRPTGTGSLPVGHHDAPRA